MKRSIPFRLLLIALALLALLGTGCGRTGSEGGTTATTTYTNGLTTSTGSCTTGYVYSSQYGCLLQSSCPTGYGLYGSQCVTLTAQSTSNSCQGTCPAGYAQTSYGCLPQAYCQSCFGYANGYCIGATNYAPGSYYWAGY